ncbi:MAG: hypothetical protein KGD64_14085, partial [Candidatus Heimdallarchaeota archaeon]|nr:hypothetical protein [Candidatus Heimdallarchaeota archaeon]
MMLIYLPKKNLAFLIFSLFLTTSLFAGLVTDVKATAAPSLINPPNGAYTNDNTPTLSWTAVLGATNYNLQISQKIDFGSPGNFFTAGTTFTVPAMPDAYYYWRVSAYSASGGGWSPWSAVRIFTIDTVAPAAPTLIDPSGDINDPTPLLRWGSVSGATNYNVKVDNNNDMSSPYIDITTATSGSNYYVESSLSVGIYWYWNVRAKDAAGNWGSTSSTWSFRIDTTPPAAATLISPVNGYTSNLIVLECSTASGANYYVFQIATDSGFTNLVESAKKTIQTHTVNEADGFYYWRVRTEDFAGNFAYSGSRTFTLDRTGPPAPSLIDPTHNEYITDSTPYLDWTIVAGTEGYQVMVDTTDQFSSPDIDIERVVSYYISTTLADNTYYWRVRGKDYLDNWGPWSTTWSFVLDTNAPLAPVLVGPVDNIETNDDTPFLDWLEVAEPSTYHLQVDTSNSFPAPSINLVDVATSFYQVVSSYSDGEYFWRVRAEDTAGNVGAWSEIRSVIIDTVGPGAPILVSPEQDEILSDSTPLILWNTVADGVEYQLQVDTANTFVSLVEDITTTNTFYTVLSDLADGTYFWRVRARDTANNWGAWSSIWSFSVDLEGPIAPTLSAPSDSAVIGDNTPYLVWSSVGDAVEYEIELALTPLFEAPVLYADTTSNNYYVIFFTLDDDVYYWRVKAKDAAGNWGDWSAVWSFTVDTVSPNIVSPEDIVYEVGATGNNFSWFPQDDNPSSYVVYLNDVILFSGAWNTTAEEIFMDVDGLGIG